MPKHHKTVSILGEVQKCFAQVLHFQPIRLRENMKRLFGKERLVTLTNHLISGSNNGANIAVLTLNDGKVNAFSFAMISALNEALEEAQMSNSRAVVLSSSKPEIFSAGFDLQVMKSKDPSVVSGLVKEGALFGIKLLESRIPIIAACSGHCLAMGAITLLCCDLRVGRKEDKTESKIGLNEVSINMKLPLMAVEVAKMRMCPSKVTQNLMFGKLMGIEEASLEGNGYLDQVIDADSHQDFVQKVVTQTEQMLQHSLKQPAFAEIKSSLRKPHLEYIKRTLEDDMKTIQSRL